MTTKDTAQAHCLLHLKCSPGEVIGECKKGHRHQEFLSFLKTVEKQTPADLDLHVIVDNYATHKHQKVKNWLKRNKRVTLHFIPTLIVVEFG